MGRAVEIRSGEIKTSFKLKRCGARLPTRRNSRKAMRNLLGKYMLKGQIGKKIRQAISIYTRQGHGDIDNLI